jgi:GABA permease
VVGFLCVIAAAVSPDTVFSFLLNSSGAIILFVYLLIAISQLILRRRTPPEKLTVKMWLFPFLTIATIAAIVAVLALMFFKEDTRSQLLLSLLAWAVVLVLYALTKWRGGSVSAEEAAAQDGGTRVLVLANETVGATELHDELRAIDREGKAEYFVCVPANPVDTGQAEHTGAVWVWEETTRAAQARLDSTLEILRADGLHAEGELGDHRPTQALAKAVGEFKPDRIVISTHPEVHSAWLRQDVVDKARHAYPAIPVRHIVVAVADSVDAPRRTV